MKNILIIQQFFYPDISAVSQLLGDLLIELDRDSFQCTVLCGSSYQNPESEYNKKEVPDSLCNIKIHRVLTTFKSGKKYPHRIFEFMKFFHSVFFYLIFNKNKYDIVVSMTSPPLICGSVVLGLGRKKNPLIYYIEDLYPDLFFDLNYIKNKFFIHLLKMINLKILNYSDMIISLGKYMTNKLLLNYNVPLNKIVEIPNWSMNISYFEPTFSDEFHILYSGNLGLAHDFSLLPKLLEYIGDCNLNIRFSFIGSGSQFNTVQKMFLNSKIKFSFRGYSDNEKHNYDLSTANLFLISQKSETIGDIFPSKFYSYLAAGRPMFLLGSKQSEIGEFLLENDIGCILDSEGDIQSVVDYISDLMINKNKYFSICNRTKNIYENKLGKEKSVAKFASLLNEVV